MATFQKRSGRVTATVRIKPHPAKSKTFDTMRDAKKWAQEIEVNLKNEKEMVYTHILLKDGLIEYRDNVSSKKRGSKQEITKINFILKNMHTELPISEVNKDMMVEWRESRLEVVKGATVRREMIVLSAFFNWCIEVKSWLQKTPLKDVKLPKDSDHRERIISDEEINTLLPLLSEGTKNIFLLALETGMRQAEICNLTWDRVHLDKCYLVLDVTKNGRFREVPLSNVAIDIFKGVGVKKSGSVFGVKSQDVSTEFMKARIKAGLYGFTFHDSRHTAATKIALKIPLLDLCKMFGWSNPRRAMIYYNPTSSEIAARLSQP